MRDILAFLMAGWLTSVSAAPARDNGGAPAPDEAGNKAAFLTDILPLQGSSRPRVDLSGPWEFRRDPENQGERLGWARGEGRFTETLQVPGAPQAQGIGEPNDSQRWSFNEPFWVRRGFSMPPLVPRQRVWLRIGGVLPAAQVYVDGEYVGYTRSSRTPQRVDVTPFLKPAAAHRIAIRVCDWPKVKLEGLWEMAELRRVWTGVYRSISIEVTDEVSIVDVYVRPKLTSGSAQVEVELTQPPTEALTLDFVVLDGKSRLGQASATVLPGAKRARAELRLSSFTPWSPEHPQLYRLDLSLSRAGQRVADRVTIRFGMREVASVGRKFFLNGQPIYLRAFGDDQFYPKTLAPPPDKTWYLSRLKRARAYGLNAAKSCEEIFTQEYLEAADEAGLLIIQEMPFGLSGYVRENQHRLAEPWRTYYGRELDGLVRLGRNHASVIAFSMCSEVPLDGGTREAFDFFCRYCPRRAKELAPHALVIDNTGYHGHTQTPQGDRITDFYAVISPAWCKEMLDETPVQSDGRHPTILHEYNWWSCYPDPRSRHAYADTAVKPWWLDVLEKTARANGQERLIPTYRKNSLWLQTVCRKDGLEYARRCPNVEGFILWLLIDFGQYTEGVLDDFWQPKNVSAKEFRQSTGDAVILLAEEGQRCLKMSQTHRLPLAISHYGEKNLGGSVLRWRASGGPLSQAGEIPLAALAKGEVNPAGAVEILLPSGSRAFPFSLRVALLHGGEEINTNVWSFWAFPETPAALRVIGTPEANGRTLEGGVFLRLGDAQSQPIPERTSLVLAEKADPALADYVARGGKCLFFTRGAAVENTRRYHPGIANFYTYFRTIPWNAGYGNSGTVLERHPALASFPHDGYCDLPFVAMIRGVVPMEFSPLRPYGVTPILRVIDWYQANQNNAHLLEFRVGKGAVLLTSLNVLPWLPSKLEVRSFLQALMDYARGPQFSPAASVPTEEFIRLLAPQPAAPGDSTLPE
jgi:hypothetical protein